MEQPPPLPADDVLPNWQDGLPLECSVHITSLDIISVPTLVDRFGEVR